MRFARRWLLIGNHQQLLPFVVYVFRKTLDSLIYWRADTLALGVGQVDTELLEGLEEWLQGCKLEDLKQEILARLSLFSNLFYAGQRTVPELSGQLTQQWRMAPPIGRLIKRAFYPLL